MHVIINENLIDADYVEKYTVGYAELVVSEFPPDGLLKHGIPTET